MTNNHLLLYRLAELMLEHERHILPVDLIFDDQRIGDFVKSIQIDSPYQQMLLEGVLTETVRDEKLYVSFTVEGYFHYVLGEVIDVKILDHDAISFLSCLLTNKLNGIQFGLQEYFLRVTKKNDYDLLFQFIDLFPSHLNLITKAVASLFVFNELKEVLDLLFKDHTDNDIKSLLLVMEYLGRNNPNRLFDLNLVIVNYPVLAKSDLFKKKYLEALHDIPIEDIDILMIDKIKTKDKSLDFELNIEKIQLHRKLGNHKNCEELINQNYDIIRVSTDYLQNDAIASFYDRISFYYSETGQYSLAIELTKKAILLSSNKDSDHGILLNNLGLRYLELRQFQNAEDTLNKAFDFDSKRYGLYSINVASRLGNLGLLYLEQGLFEKAIEFLRRACQIDKILLGPNHENIATRLINISEVLRKTEKLEDALKSIHEARRIDLFNYGEGHPILAFSYNIEAHILRQMGKIEDAIAAIQEAIRINLQFQNGINDRLNRDYNFLGVTYAKEGDINQALYYFIEAEKIENNLFEDIPHMRIITWLNICKTYKKLGHTNQFKSYLNKIHQLPENVREEYKDVLAELYIQ